MRAEPPVDYRSAYQDRDTVKTLNRFIDGVYDGGIMMLNTAAGALSTAMDVPEIDRLAEVVEHSLRTIRN